MGNWKFGTRDMQIKMYRDEQNAIADVTANREDKCRR